MKTINVTFTDAEFNRLKKARKIFDIKYKTGINWRDFILVLTRGISIRHKK